MPRSRSTQLQALPERSSRAESEEPLADGAVGVGEAVRFAGVGRTVLYGAMATGALCYLRVGRRRLIPKRALVRFLAEHLEP